MKCEDDKGLCENTPSRKTQMFYYILNLIVHSVKSIIQPNQDLATTFVMERIPSSSLSIDMKKLSRLESFQQWQMVEQVA